MLQTELRKKARSYKKTHQRSCGVGLFIEEVEDDIGRGGTNIVGDVFVAQAATLPVFIEGGC